jgi:2-phospho-L-lactate/phosphoenolpyruvate guanylyltransferase
MPNPSAVRLVALIPIKSLAHGKSRLSGALSPAKRIDITEAALRRLIHALHSLPEVHEIAVVTRDADVIEWLAGRRVRVLRETGDGLNEALREARAQLEADALLVLPADLVALTPQDVHEIVALSGTAERAVVIAPDRHGHGTNALLLKPPGMIDMAFGADSFALHQAAAERAGAQVFVYRSDTVALDLDVPEDYALYDGQW